MKPASMLLDSKMPCFPHPFSWDSQLLWQSPHLFSVLLKIYVRKLNFKLTNVQVRVFKVVRKCHPSYLHHSLFLACNHNHGQSELCCWWKFDSIFHLTNSHHFLFSHRISWRHWTSVRSSRCVPAVGSLATSPAPSRSSPRTARRTSLNPTTTRTWRDGCNAWIWHCQRLRNLAVFTLLANEGCTRTSFGHQDT